MDCREARDRLVALQDDELSPGETVQVSEHLDGCRSCRAHERRLARATPMPDLRLPPEARALLEARVDLDVILARAEREGSGRERSSTAPASDGWRRWLGRETPVPAAGLVAYAALLALALGWGLSNWWSLSALRGAPPTTVTAGVIPADQFAPAAYAPPLPGPPAAAPAPLVEPHAPAADAPRDEVDRSAGAPEGGGFH